MWNLGRFILRVTGFAPNHRKCDKYFLVFALIILLYAYKERVDFWRSNTKTSLQGKMVWISVTSICLGNMETVFSINVHQDSFSSLLSSASSASAISRTETKKTSIIFGVVLFSSVCSAILKAYQVLSCDQPCISEAFGVVNVYYYTLAIWSFIKLTQLITHQYCDLNKSVQAVLVRSNQPSMKSREGLVLLFRKHHELRVLIQDINSFYSYRSCCFYFGIFGHVLSYLFNIIMSITDRKLNVAIVKGISLFPASVLLIAECVACHICLKEANRTVMIAHRSLDTDSPLEVMEYVEDFSLTMFNNPVKFSVAGLFCIDNTLITKAVAMIVTYLIISVQLSTT